MEYDSRTFGSIFARKNAKITEIMPDALKAVKFIEKPKTKEEKEELKGKVYVNTGIYMFSAQTYLDELKKFAPQIYNAIEKQNIEKTPSELNESNEKNQENRLVEKTNNLGEGNGLSDEAMYFTVFLSLLLSVGMFILIPNFVADLIVPEGSVTLYNIVENVIKIAEEEAKLTYLLTMLLGIEPLPAYENIEED